MTLTCYIFNTQPSDFEVLTEDATGTGYLQKKAGITVSGPGKSKEKTFMRKSSAREFKL